jgi:hypothetical protein
MKAHGGCAWGCRPGSEPRRRPLALTRVRLPRLPAGIAFSRGERTRRVLQAWVLAGVVGLGLSACAASSPNKPTPVSLPAAVSKTEQIATGRVTETLSASQGGQSLSLLSYRYTFDNPEKLLSATVDYRNIVANQPAALKVAKLSDWVFQFVIDSRRPTVFYWRWPAFLTPQFQKQIPVKARGKEWMRLDVAALLRTKGGQLESFVRSQLTAVLPGLGSPLRVLDAVSTQAARIDGSERLAGTSTTRFRTTADMTRANSLGQLVAKLAQLAGSTWQAEVWVDDSSLVRRVRFTSPPVRSQGNATYAITYDPSGLGAPVTIQVPPATNVFDIAALGS